MPLYNGLVMRKCKTYLPSTYVVNCAQSRALYFVALRNADSLKRTSFDFPTDLLSITTSRLYLFVVEGTYCRHTEGRNSNNRTARREEINLRTHPV